MSSSFKKIKLDTLIVDSNGMFSITDKNVLKAVSGAKGKKGGGGGGGGTTNVVCHGCNLGCSTSEN